MAHNQAVSALAKHGHEDYRVWRGNSKFGQAWPGTCFVLTRNIKLDQTRPSRPAAAKSRQSWPWKCWFSDTGRISLWTNNVISFLGLLSRHPTTGALVEGLTLTEELISLFGTSSVITAITTLAAHLANVTSLSLTMGNQHLVG